MGDGRADSGESDAGDAGDGAGGADTGSDRSGSDRSGSDRSGSDRSGSGRSGTAAAALGATTHSALLVLGAFLVASLFSTAGAEALRAVGIAVASPSPGVTAVLVALQFVGFLVVGYWYLARVGDRELVHLERPTLRVAGWIVVGLVGLYALNFVAAAVLATLGIEPAANRVIVDNRDQPVALLYLAAVSVLFVAPGEELLFRGVVQGLFRRVAGAVPAVAVASMAFGLVHVPALIGVPETDPTVVQLAAYVVIAALLGAVLGTVYERTRTLAAPVAIHGLWNAYQFLAVYAVETGAVGTSL